MNYENNEKELATIQLNNEFEFTSDFYSVVRHMTDRPDKDTRINKS